MLPEERVAEFEAPKILRAILALNFFIEAIEIDPEYTYFAEVDGNLSVGRILTGRGIESGPVESAIDFIFNSDAAKKIRKSSRRRFFYIQTINTETGELGERIPTTIGMLIGAGLRINQRSRNL